MLCVGMRDNPHHSFIQKILEDAKASRRVLRSYEMMLDFYGMKLKDSKTGWTSARV